MKTLIIQSCKAHPQKWINDCMHTVELWCELNHFEYIRYGDDPFFAYVPPAFGCFTKVTQSDIARLDVIEFNMREHQYDRVYWIDSDFLIWDIRNFKLPAPESGAVVCAREAFRACGSYTIMFNNSVLGFCDPNDVALLREKSVEMLQRKLGQKVRQTIVGTDLFSSMALPLRRIVATHAGLFSAESISMILGPWIAGRVHLLRLSILNGGTMYGANLCSSRENDQRRMAELINNLILGRSPPVVHAWTAPIYRTFFRVHAFPFRVRCWLMTRWWNLTTREPAKP
jgi:hypothetical protein